MTVTRETSAMAPSCPPSLVRFGVRRPSATSLSIVVALSDAFSAPPGMHCPSGELRMTRGRKEIQYVQVGARDYGLCQRARDSWRRKVQQRKRVQRPMSMCCRIAAGRGLSMFVSRQLQCLPA